MVALKGVQCPNRIPGAQAAIPRVGCFFFPFFNFLSIIVSLSCLLIIFLSPCGVCSPRDGSLVFLSSCHSPAAACPFYSGLHSVHPTRSPPPPPHPVAACFCFFVYPKHPCRVFQLSYSRIVPTFTVLCCFLFIRSPFRQPVVLQNSI